MDINKINIQRQYRQLVQLGRRIERARTNEQMNELQGNLDYLYILFDKKETALDDLRLLKKFLIEKLAKEEQKRY